jgi:hypothetical protein
VVEAGIEREMTMSSDWQEDLDVLASLGKPIREFVVSGRVLLLRLALAFVLVLAGGGLFALLILAKGHHVHILIWGPLLALMGVTQAIRAYRNWGLRVLLYPEGGIRFQHDRVVTFFWEELARVWRKTSDEHWSSAWQGSLTLTLEKTTGETIQFDDALPGLRDLAVLVEEKSLPHLLSDSISKLESGEMVDFGELTVHPQGLKTEKGKLTWEEVKEIKCDKSALAIYKNGKKSHWCNLKVAVIPNYHVVLPLVRHMVASRTLEG